jgi:hypothetical protein
MTGLTPGRAAPNPSAPEVLGGVSPSPESSVDRNPAFRQLEANQKDLRSAFFGILAFIVVYAALAMFEWISSAWGEGAYSVQSSLPFLILFELAIIGLVVGGLSMTHRRQLELDQLRRQLASDEAGDRRPPSPLARAEMLGGILRALSRQVDSLLLWLPFAIVVTVWIGLILLTNLPGRGANSTPLDRTLGLAVVLLGVPTAVAVFGVGVLLTIRRSSKRQVRLSRDSLEWWNAGPPTSGTEPPESSGVPRESSYPMSTHPSSTVARLVRRRKEERRVVLVTAAGALLAMAALAGVGAGVFSYLAGPFDCCLGLNAPMPGILFGILLAGFIPPAYVGVLVLRRPSALRSIADGPGERGRPSDRISDTIAWFVQAESLRVGLREDSRDGLWLAWFAAVWSIGGLFLLWTFNIQPFRGFSEFPGTEAGPLIALLVGESVVALVPLALAALATVMWQRRRRDDLASEDESRSALQAFAALEQGFWERF